jgi:hypothetical protein
VNAAEQANSIEFASKIAAIVGLFKGEFPDLRVDLRPWANDQETLDLVDPDSIDIGFHFPGVSRLFQCRSLLVQIRFYQDPDTHQRKVIGLDVAGFDHRGNSGPFQPSTIGLSRAMPAPNKPQVSGSSSAVARFSQFLVHLSLSGGRTLNVSLTTESGQQTKFKTANLVRLWAKIKSHCIPSA